MLSARPERLGIVSFTNVAPLNWGLTPWSSNGGTAEFVYGVPTVLNAALAAGDIDLTLVSSIEFIRHRDRYRALSDFSIATLGPVYSVMLFHRPDWRDLQGARVAVTTESATSVEMLRVLLAAEGITSELVPTSGSLDEMLSGADAALLIGDAALKGAVAHLRPTVGGPSGRPVSGRSVADPGLRVTDLGEAWYRLTRLPFTFAVWASSADVRPSAALVSAFRDARSSGLGNLADVAAIEAEKLGLPAQIVQRYLENFRYYLEPPDLDGLVAFATRSDPGFEAGQLRFWGY
ncbi:MAG TPA: menaquinone biosynthesis protein [Trueperaceae bacterium]|nr:menaquinone biosynthesis protein [Trueperaceae bacterium]